MKNYLGWLFIMGPLLSFQLCFGQSIQIEFINGDVALYDLNTVGKITHDLDTLKLFQENGSSYAWNKSSIKKYSFSPSSLSIEELNMDQMIDNFLIYPNPIDGPANLKFTLYTKSNVVIELLNVEGRLHQKFDQGEMNAGEQKVLLDLGKDAFGPAFLRIRCADFTITKKIIINTIK